MERTMNTAVVMRMHVSGDTWKQLYRRQQQYRHVYRTSKMRGSIAAPSDIMIAAKGRSGSERARECLQAFKAWLCLFNALAAPIGGGAWLLAICTKERPWPRA
jgi:hypothetical protein